MFIWHATALFFTFFGLHGCVAVVQPDVEVPAGLTFEQSAHLTRQRLYELWNSKVG